MEFLKMLQEIRNPFLTKLFELSTFLGEELFVIALICLLYWCINKKLAYRIGFAYFLSGLCVQFLKINFRIPRPWVRDSSLVPVPSAIKTATGYSFPSGHTQSGTALFTSIALYTNKKLIRILCILAIFLVGFSRMYLGVHTPQDVLVSFAITLVLTLIVYFASKHYDKICKYKLSTTVVMIIFSASILIVAILLLRQGVIEEHYVSDCCKAAAAGIGFAIGWYIETTYINFEETGLPVPKQVLKFILGITIAVILKSGLKLLLGSSLLVDGIRYFIVVLWVIMIYPWIIKKVFHKTNTLH